MLRFDEGVVLVQKGGRGGCGPHCQNLRPRYRSTHRHTLEEEERERVRGMRGEKEGRVQKNEREGKTECRNAGKKAKRENITETEREKIHFYSACPELEHSL